MDTLSVAVHEDDIMPQSEMTDTFMLSGAEKQPLARFSKLPVELKVTVLDFVGQTVPKVFVCVTNVTCSGSNGERSEQCATRR